MENYILYSIIAILVVIISYITASNKNDFSILFTKRKKLQLLIRLFKQYKYKDTYISEAKFYLSSKKEDIPEIIQNNMNNPYDLSCAIVIFSNYKYEKHEKDDVEIAKKIHLNYHTYDFADYDLVKIADKILKR